MAPGGLEGCKPSQNHSFLVVFAGKASKHHQKNGEIGETPGTLWVRAPGHPKPLHSASRVNETIYDNAHLYVWS